MEKMMNILNSHAFKSSLLSFLDHQHNEQDPGYYRYSYSGDFFRANQQKNLAGGIFALKLYYMLGASDHQRIQPIIDRILSFQKKDGSIYDPFVFRKGFIRNVLANLKRGNFDKMNNQQYVRAETRQAYSALLLHGVIPEKIYSDVPTEPVAIKKFIRSLDWSKPWGAGSHFSHLMFFLPLLNHAKKIDSETFEQAKRSAIHEIKSLHHTQDGSWYRGNPSSQEKINGAMKVITGFLWTGEPLQNPEQLIDLCLSHKDPVHACDQINKTLVLRHANEATHGSYRREEIVVWCEETLEDWQKYYHPVTGGFSFWKGRANNRYYGARVTRGFDEPDIHGTVLFVWGLSMMATLMPFVELDWIKELKS